MLLVIYIFAESCTPFTRLDATLDLDLNPPNFERISVHAPREIVLEFGEPLSHISELRIIPELSIAAQRIAQHMLHISFTEDAELGVEYRVFFTVSDASGNAIHAIVPFWGFNAQLPHVLINEFTVEGSGSHTDMVELVCLSSGNIGGLTVYDGAPADWDERIILPDVMVQEGDFILIHWKPEGIEEEIDELSSQADSGGNDASNSAWDYWVKEGNGLPNTTGLIVLSESPTGPIRDAVLYSTKSYDPEREDRGFGRLLNLQRMESVVQESEWHIQGEFLVPEDTFNPEASTATRSICRNSHSEDHNIQEDWHIVPTRASSFGMINSDARHEYAK